jgi:Uma2 family endonuclease
MDWHVLEHTVVRPDISVVCGEYPKGAMVDAPRLIIEIASPSTALRDRNEKQQLYGNAGVPHYLLADPETRELTDGFDSQRSGDHVITLHEGCSIKLPARVEPY